MEKRASTRMHTSITGITSDLRDTLLDLAKKYRWKEVFQDAQTGEVLDATRVDNSSLYLLDNVVEIDSPWRSPVVKTGVLPGSVTKRSRRGNTRARMSLDMYLNHEELLDSPVGATPTGVGFLEASEPATPENVLTAMFDELAVTPHVAPAFRMSTIDLLMSDDDGDDDEDDDGQDGEEAEDDKDGEQADSVDDDQRETASTMFIDLLDNTNDAADEVQWVGDVGRRSSVAGRRRSGKRVSIIEPPVRHSNANTGERYNEHKNKNDHNDSDDDGECEWTEDWLMNTPAPKPAKRSTSSSEQFVLRKPLTPRQPRKRISRNSTVDLVRESSSDSDYSEGNDAEDTVSSADDSLDSEQDSETSEDDVYEEEDTYNDSRDDGSDDDSVEVQDESDEGIEKENLPHRTPNRANGKTPCMFAQFRRNRETLARKWFDTFNRRVFSSLLPADTQVKWTKQLRSTAGRCYPRRNGDQRVAHIELSTKVLDMEERMKSTLLHEMCHAAAWIVDATCRPPHGKVFYKWGAIAGRKYPDLPVTTCHNFVIHKPYKYRCTVCDWRYGRHTKNSIKLDLHRCRCGGKLEFEGMFKPDGTPHKPRVANGFSLFVKENYARVKAANPGLSQADIMREIAAAYKARDTAAMPSSSAEASCAPSL